MDVAIPRMAEAGEGEAVFFLETGGEFHEVHQAPAWNDDVLVQLLEAGGFERLRVKSSQTPEGFAGFGSGRLLNARSAGIFEKFFEVRGLRAHAGRLAVHFNDHLRLAGWEFCRGAVGAGCIERERIRYLQSRWEETCGKNALDRPRCGLDGCKPRR